MGRVRNPCDLPSLHPHLMQTNNVATHGNELPINLDLVPRPHHGKVVIDLHRKLAQLRFVMIPPGSNSKAPARNLFSLRPLLLLPKSHVLGC